MFVLSAWEDWDCLLDSFSCLFLYIQCLFDQQKQTRTVVGILLLVRLLTYFGLFDHQKKTGNAIGILRFVYIQCLFYKHG